MPTTIMMTDTMKLYIMAARSTRAEPILEIEPDHSTEHAGPPAWAHSFLPTLVERRAPFSVTHRSSRHGPFTRDLHTLWRIV